MAAQFTLGKNERLKSRKQIGILFSEGKKIVSDPFIIHFLINENAGEQRFPLQFGVSVPSRIFKKAPHRNRVKRLIRESFRLQKPELVEKLRQHRKVLYLFFIYNKKEILAYNEIFAKTTTAINKLVSLVK